MHQQVLVVLPHPDDESFGAAGTIALEREAGAKIAYICGTLGEMGRNMGRPVFATRESLPDIRKGELESACSVLGISDLRLFGLRDKTVEFEDPEILADRILAVVKELHPTLVITHYPGFAVHPDHNAMGRATILALSKIPTAQRPTVYCMAMAQNRFDVLGKPHVLVDVSSVQGTKLAAIQAHGSQSQGMLQRAKAEGDTPMRRRMEQFLKQEMFWHFNFEG